MKEKPVILLGGPLDGKMVRVPDYMDRYMVCERLPISVDIFKKPDLFSPAIKKSTYRRMTSRTFMHETEL